ncbi:MAG: hypothetical protein M0Z66_14540 [Thermaerobacter sp.]|nr:hypothetical protein [Thermaerobacter sp.]
MQTLVLNADDVRELLSQEVCIGALEDAFSGAGTRRGRAAAARRRMAS